MTTTTFNAPAASLFGSLRQAFSALIGAAPKALSRAQEAAEVREMARRLQAADPGFAADLYAAADRHEVSDR